MTNDLLTQAETEPEIPMDDEPEIALDEEPEIPADEPEVPAADPGPECDCIASGNPNKPKQHGADPHAKNCAIYTGGSPAAAALAPLPLVQVLPADFPLPALIRFVPDTRLKVQAEQAAAYALGIAVQGAEGMLAADTALTVLRSSQKAIEEHFAEPVDVANRLHKSLTGTRAEWLAAGKTATDTVGRRIYIEKSRLDAIAAEERRKAQAAADQIAREEARRRAAEAEKAKAPAPVVESLKRQAEVAQAAPVVATTTTTPKLSGTSTVKNWQPTIAGTPRDAEQQPAMADLTDAQRAVVLGAMRAVLDGKAPIACFDINWSYLKKRAKADEAAFAIPGFEAYDAGGVRAKGTRSK